MEELNEYKTLDAKNPNDLTDEFESIDAEQDIVIEQDGNRIVIDYCDYDRLILELQKARQQAQAYRAFIFSF